MTKDRRKTQGNKTFCSSLPAERQCHSFHWAQAAQRLPPHLCINTCSLNTTRWGPTFLVSNENSHKSDTESVAADGCAPVTGTRRNTIGLGRSRSFCSLSQSTFAATRPRLAGPPLHTTKRMEKKLSLAGLFKRPTGPAPAGGGDEGGREGPGGGLALENRHLSRHVRVEGAATQGE